MTRGCGAVLIICSCLLSVNAAAQGVQRVEAGGQIGVAQITEPEPGGTFGPWVDLNLSKNLAIEARATAIKFRGTSGTHVEAGVKATFVRSNRLSFYGLAMPGAYHIALAAPIVVFSNPHAEEIDLGSADPSSSTHFVLDIGAGVGINVGRRVVLRIEGMREIHAQPEQFIVGDVFGNPPATETFSLPTPIGSEWDIHFGGSYLFGRTLPTRASEATATRSPRWTIGPQVGATVSTSEAVSAAIGGFASYRLFKYFDLDAAVSTFVGGSGLEATALEGGHMSQAVVGGKVGLRLGRTAVFFKMRAGVNSYSRVATPQILSSYGRSTVPALDLGGVIELSVTPKTVLRFDVGESLSFMPSRLTVGPDFDQTRFYRFKLYSLPMRVGMGWRF